MRIFKAGNQINLDEEIRVAERLLKENKIYILETLDHLQHIAAYVAWKNVGGNIFVLNPQAFENDKTYLRECAATLNVKDSIVFHTSGTTGRPKLVVHTEKQFNWGIRANTEQVGWNSNTRYLNLHPASTIAMWNMVISLAHHYHADLTLGDPSNVPNEIVGRSANIVPAIIDRLRQAGANMDLSQSDFITSGAGQVLDRHVQYLFDNGAKYFCGFYGLTETFVPTLTRVSHHYDEHTICFNPVGINGDNVKLTDDGELLVFGPSLCENWQTMKTIDGWFATGDLFTVNNAGLLVYNGRNDDIVKIHGYKANLLELEQLIEEKTDLGRSLALLKDDGYGEYIELFYSNQTQVDTEKLTAVMVGQVPKYAFPKKYTYIKEIPTSLYGKKSRAKLKQHLEQNNE